MKLIYGVPTTGKTFAQKLLQQDGYKCIDFDDLKPYLIENYWSLRSQAVNSGSYNKFKNEIKPLFEVKFLDWFKNQLLLKKDAYDFLFINDPMIFNEHKIRISIGFYRLALEGYYHYINRNINENRKHNSNEESFALTHYWPVTKEEMLKWGPEVEDKILLRKDEYISDFISKIKEISDFNLNTHAPSLITRR